MGNAEQVGRWLTPDHVRPETLVVCREQDPKRVYYLSMEFLMGRSLLNTLYNLDVAEPYAEALREMGYK